MAAGSRIWAALKKSRGVFNNDFSRYTLATFTWIPVVIFIKDHVCELTTIRGPSMSPFFNERYNETTKGDICLAWKMNAQKNLKRGQIVTFRWEKATLCAQQ